jgi:transcriptional regulator with XRE-family HTH domain
VEQPEVPTGADAVTAAVAHNVRSLRLARGWTLDALAARSGVSKGMVVQVEQSRTNASVQTLWRLASALGVGLPRLLETDAAPVLRVVPGDQAVRLWNGAGGGSGDFLVGSEQPVTTELWDWTLAPGDGYDGQIHPKGSREMLYVLEGTVTLILDHRQRTPLSARSTALYTADRAHRIENETDEAARLIMVLIEGLIT